MASVEDVSGGGLTELRVDQGVTLRVLGPLTAELNGTTLSLGGPKERTVLAVLIAAEGQAVTIEALTESLWDDSPPATAERTLHAYVARLRKSLGATSIVTHGRGYALGVGPSAIDARRFVEAAAAGRACRDRGDPGGAVASFDRALAEWGGAAFLGHDDVDPCAGVARRLDEVHRTVVEDRFEAMLDLGHSAELIADLGGAVKAEPYRERLWASLMIAQYRAGRRADALRSYQDAREQLVEGIGVDPGPRLQEIEAAVLADDNAVLGGSAPRPLIALPSLLDPGGSAFVSRTLELERIRDAWMRVGHGLGQLMSITGREGAGKTRLIGEVAREVHAEGGVVAYARSDATHRSSRSVLDQALRSAGGSLLAAQSAAPPGESLGTAVARLLARWSERQPVLLVLDDLHEAEDDVLALVSDVAAGVTDAAVLVVAVFRGDSPDGASAPNQVALQGLPRDGVAAVCQVYGDDWTGAEIDGVLSTTGGWPLAVHEAAAQRAHRGFEQRAGIAADATRSAEQRLVASQDALIDEIVSMRRSARTRGREMRTRAPARVDGDPYRGLSRFEREDSPWFFGRDAAVGEVIAELAAHPALAVVGASGSGKSSLIRAGVLPALGQGALPGSESWDAVVVMPGSDPVDTLRNAMADTGGPRRLLVVDQFEELFSEANSSARDEFAELLFDHVARGNLLIAVVRADQLAHLADLSALDAMLAGHTALVAPMREDGLRDAIEGPLEVAGLRAEDGLVETILADAQGAKEVLPLLQTAMLATWERRTGDLLTIGSYRAAGGVAGAIARLAEEMYAGLTPDEAAAAGRMFVRMIDVDRGGAIDLRRRVDQRELIGGDETAAAGALVAAVRHRLVVIDADTVEITHEALVREWPRLARWIEDDREGHRLHQRLGDSARAWVAGGRDPSELLRGARLEAVDEWATGHLDHLNEAERELLAASRSAALAELAEAERRAADQEHANTRLRRRLVVAAVLLVVALMAMSAAAWQWGRQRSAAADARDAGELAEAETETARVAQETAEAAQREAENQAGRALTAERGAEDAQLTSDARRLSAEALVDQDIDRGLLSAVAGVRLDDRPETRAGIVAAFQRAPLATAIGRLDNGARPQGVRASPDGSILAVPDNEANIRLLDAATLDERAVVEGGWGLHFVGDGRLVLALPESPSLAIVDPTDLVERQVLTGGAVPATLVHADRTGRWVIANNAPTGEGVVIWDTTRPDEPVRTYDYGQMLYGLGIVDSGQSAVLVGSGTKPGEIVDVKTGEVTARFDAGNALAVTPDGDVLATVSGNDYRKVLLYDVGSSEPYAEFGVPGTVAALAFSSDGTMVAVGTSGGTQLFRNDGTFVLRLEGQTENSRGLAFAADGASLYGANLDGTIMRWDISGASAALRWQSMTEGVITRADRFGAQYMSRQGHIAVPVQDGTRSDILVVSHRDSGTPLRIETGHAFINPDGSYFGSINAVAWAPDGSAVATGSGDARVRLWDPLTGAPLGEWTAPLLRSVFSLQFDPTGNSLLVGLMNDTLPEDAPPGPDVVVLDAHTLAEIDTYEIPEMEGAGRFGAVWRVSLDPSGGHLLVECCESNAGRLTLIDLADGTELWSANGPNVFSTAFSSDGERLAVGWGDGTLTVLSTIDGSTIAGPVNAHDGWADTVDFGLDGTTLVTGGTDGLTRLWRADDLVPLGTYDLVAGRDQVAVPSRFTKDGTAIQIYDGRKLWTVPVDSEELIGQICAAVGRDLTEKEWSDLVPAQPYRSTCS